MNLQVEDLYDIAFLCHAALAQDSPNTKEHYINQILNMTWAHLPKHYRNQIAEDLAEKKYLPPVDLILPNKEIVT